MAKSIPKSGPENLSEHLAKASAHSLPVSTKHCIELCRYLKYRPTLQAKKLLEEVIALRRAVPFQRFNQDMGHKAGMSAGRFPQKAARQLLKLVKSVEANAQFKGLNTSRLKIIKLLANQASIPLTGGRHRTATKRTHLEIEVMESLEKKATEKKTSEKKIPERKKVQKKVQAKKDSSSPSAASAMEKPRAPPQTPTPAGAGKTGESPK